MVPRHTIFYPYYVWSPFSRWCLLCLNVIRYSQRESLLSFIGQTISITSSGYDGKCWALQPLKVANYITLPFLISVCVRLNFAPASCECAKLCKNRADVSWARAHCSLTHRLKPVSRSAVPKIRKHLIGNVDQQIWESSYPLLLCVCWWYLFSSHSDLKVDDLQDLGFWTHMI